MFGLFRKKKQESEIHRRTERPIARRVYPKKVKKSWSRKERILVVTFLLATVLFALAAWFSGGTVQYPPSLPKISLPIPQETIVIEGSPEPTMVVHGERVKVIKVIDGDTIVLDNGKTVRYIGVDAPERGRCFFAESKAANERLVLNKEVEFEKDVSETDKYGRLLRYVWIPAVFPGEQGFIAGEQLVREGFALSSTYQPDVKYQERFLRAQAEAQQQSNGIWVSCREDLSKNKAGTSVLGATDDKDCSDFKAQKEAQQFFISQGGPGKDPHKLDADRDGQVCESLP